MARRRKSDRSRLKEKRGQGNYDEYVPWIKIHEISSQGLGTRLNGWKTGRIHQYLSNLERDYYFLIQWEDAVIDIKEQYPLLPIQKTELIAKKLGIKHPYNRFEGKNSTMTTDFLITVQKENIRYDIARTIKPSSKLTARTMEKFLIEQEYWKDKNVDWGIVTEKQINKVKAKNIQFVYQANQWNSSKGLDKSEIWIMKEYFIELYLRNNRELRKTLKDHDNYMEWLPGESLAFLKFLIAKKLIKVDMNRDITKLGMGKNELLL